MLLRTKVQKRSINCEEILYRKRTSSSYKSVTLFLMQVDMVMEAISMDVFPKIAEAFHLEVLVFRRSRNRLKVKRNNKKRQINTNMYSFHKYNIQEPFIAKKYGLC